MPITDIHSVGAGGGSIGWVDQGGSLRVAPTQRGLRADVCYSRSGTSVCVRLLLGRLDPTLNWQDDAGRREPQKRAMADLANESAFPRWRPPGA